MFLLTFIQEPLFTDVRLSIFMYIFMYKYSDIGMHILYTYMHEDIHTYAMAVSY